MKPPGGPIDHGDTPQHDQISAIIEIYNNTMLKCDTAREQHRLRAKCADCAVTKTQLHWGIRITNRQITQNIVAYPQM